MKRKVVAAVSGILLLISGAAMGQTSNVAFFMNLPQAHYLNPALKPATRFYIAIPVVSGINMTIGNNFIKLTDIFTPGLKADSIFSFQNPNFDLKKLASKLHSKNAIMAEGSIQILGVGVPIGKNYSFTFDVTDRFSGKMVFPKSLLDIYLAGASGLIGKTVNISDLNMQAMIFREYAAGVSGEVIPNLRVGARLKLLSGLGSISFDDKSFDLTINNDLTQTVNANATMQIAGKAEMDKISNGGSFGQHLSNYIKMPLKNPGFGIDLGAEYRLGRFFTFSIGIKDLGFINWKTDVQAWKANNTFTLPGITLQDVQDQSFSIDKMASSLADSIKANFRSVNAPSAFKTKLPTEIIAGASFTPIKLVTFGVLSVVKMYAGSTNQATTLSANLHLGQVFSASAAYTLANSSYNNLGLGMAVKAGVAQIYFIADKIPMSWDKIYFPKNGSYQKVPLPGNFNMVSFQFGVNIVFGKQVTRKTDKPVLESKDNAVQQQQ